MSTTANTAWTEVLPHRQPDQIAYVVPDLREAVALWSAILGRDDWRVYTYGPENAVGLTYRGSEVGYSMRLAICGSTPQVELIESLQGPNVYSEQLERTGPSLHHVGFFVESVADIQTQLAEAGIKPVQTGRGYGLDGDGGFAYYELPGVGSFVEYIEVPLRRRPSERFDDQHTPNANL